MTTRNSHESWYAPPQPARYRLAPVQLGLLLVIAAETVLFGTLLSAFLFVRSTTAAPYENAGLLRLALPILNTLVLIASAWVARSANRAALSGRRDVLRNALLSAFFLGGIFVAGQILEFSRSGMRPAGPALGGMYFALIGFHAAHVVAGMVALALLSVRASLGDFTPRRSAPVTAGYWFWLYVTAIWIVLFIALYLV